MKSAMSLGLSVSRAVSPSSGTAQPIVSWLCGHRLGRSVDECRDICFEDSWLELYAIGAIEYLRCTFWNYKKPVAIETRVYSASVASQLGRAREQPQLLGKRE